MSSLRLFLFLDLSPPEDEKKLGELILILAQHSMSESSPVALVASALVVCDCSSTISLWLSVVTEESHCYKVKSFN